MTAIEQFNALVATAQARGASRAQAIRATAGENPDLHRRYLAESNAEPPEKTDPRLDAILQNPRAAMHRCSGFFKPGLPEATYLNDLRMSLFSYNLDRKFRLQKALSYSLGY
ncbi:hypothetical protein [uncultured Thiocystis sp.]|jgi:hypothetical protein|uniref:hypothetical protein n=1 Tax=uncultured Thiocystis sp. TaxID=1202134 RepID=UPI0025E1ED72|nr:hypothetical protein [uncultured Thiocystis sp.]